MTVGEFITTVEAIHGFETTTIHGDQCFAAHPLPTGRTLLPIDTEMDAMPRLDCSCFDMIELERGAKPVRRYLGMGN